MYYKIAKKNKASKYIKTLAIFVGKLKILFLGKKKGRKGGLLEREIHLFFKIS